MGSAMRLIVGVALALSAPTLVAFDEPRGESGWYAGAGARVLKLEGWQEGYGPSLLLGWKLPYQHAETPRSSIALEGELTGTTESLSRRAGDEREEADLVQAGAYLALNTFVGERFFHRVRLGVVAREFDRPGSTRLQGRLAFGLGAGLRLSDSLDVLVDAQTQYWSWPDDLLHEAGVTARWHF
ncbi:hypothetical protein [Aquisalimonas asiatica]|uniref:Outer membrane protein beta-barrel domain-containing protein n=1 Tax=Aquisalimonas asiatica TaxID=406100 RepID=A0A1H8QG99_9GAMM|nr:hypothetical protein [Aquisalimonas asiatica]SEO53021.1 hypothetical protein SAMN04488052_101557 [Aquisalimonas asiatica]